MSEILGIGMTLVGTLAFVAIIVCGLTRCPKCGGWCGSETERCAEEKTGERILRWSERSDPNRWTEQPTCGACKKTMTPENASIIPEMFLCDECAKLHGYSKPGAFFTPGHFAVGERVHYISFGGKPENGIVKSKHPTSASVVFVVYACNDDWENYQNYTGASTLVTDLRKGWV